MQNYGLSVEASNRVDNTAFDARQTLDRTSGLAYNRFGDEVAYHMRDTWGVK